jgi:hypothetical protein
MAAYLEAGERVYVATTRVPNMPDLGKAFFHTHVVEREDRSIRVNLLGGAPSDWISTRYAHRVIGVCIIEAGDFDTEATLLDPLQKSILQNCRIIFGDDELVRSWKVRSLEELREIWRSGVPRSFDQVILIGHGSGGQSMMFGRTAHSADEIAASVEDGQRQWKFILTSCELGRAAFSKAFSYNTAVDHIIAPFHSIHGAIAAQFTQTYLVRNLITAETPLVAFKNAAWSVPGNASFRFWSGGSMRAGY